MPEGARGLPAFKAQASLTRKRRKISEIKKLKNNKRFEASN